MITLNITPIVYMNIKYLKYQFFKVIQYHHKKNYPKNYVQTISILFSSWRTFVDIKIYLYMSWETTLNKQGMKFSNFTKMVIKKVNISHECKESKNANRLLRASMTSEFIVDENEIQ